MKKLSELAKEVYNARSLPGVLADLHIEIASIYANMSEEWVEIQISKALFWATKDYDMKECKPREKPLSDKQVEMMWLQKDEGIKEIRLKYALRSLEKLMSAVKSSLVNATIEARNL
jgi:hypothetical protein